MRKLFYLTFVIIFLFIFKLNFAQQKSPLEISNMDFGINPGDDFFRFANGNWLKNNPVPPDKVRYGAFDELTDLNQIQIKTLIEESAVKNAEKGSDYQKIGDFYLSGMDSVSIELAGIKPIESFIVDINKISDFDELYKYIAYLHTYRINPLFGVYAGQDEKNSEMVIISLYQGGLGLGDRDYYLKDDNRSKEIRSEYKNFIKDMFLLKGDSPELVNKKMNSIFEIETRIANITYSRLDLRDPEKNYNKVKYAELKNICPSFDWDYYFNYIGSGIPEEVDVSQIKFFEGLSEIINSFSIDDWKAYLEWNVIRNTAPYLNSDFVNRHFDFYGKFISGQKEMKLRWRRVIETVNSSVSEIIGKIYVEKYFSPEAKQRVYNLVLDLKSALKKRIEDLKWMSPPTKEKAIEKLDKMAIRVGYPNKWRDYSGLEITRDSYLQNILRANNFNFKFNISKAGKPVDKELWGMSPQTVNAYYSPTLNAITFPAGILQPPFFFENGDDAVNYGGIGVVIGHEMTHGFDDQGRKYDANGNLNDWWTIEDANKYKEMTSILVTQFNNFVINDSLYVDGELTLGENISDLGGVTIALNAVKEAWKRNPPPEKIDGFTPLQRFFLSYAQIWRSNIRDKELMRRLKEDVHSPAIARVNGIVYNIPEFYEAFNIKPSDKRYIKPELRAVIW
ncbi:MAG: M13 family metallopeptidase [Ignavibacteria bacterium]|nr:M13 family metallopeptidase [Ignavibacteria bacterium]